MYGGSLPPVNGPGFVVGVLDRHGPPDAERLRDAAQVHGGQAQTLVSGALGLAWTGEVSVARDGGAVGLVDGLLDRGARDAADVLTGGEGLLGALRGDFAVLVWDGRTGFLARDHLGARGWVIHDDGGRMTFATETAPLLAALAARPGPSEVTVAHWLSFSGIPGEHTFFAGVDRLPAGSLRALDPHRPAASRRYWTPRYRKPEKIGLDEAAARTRAALEESVRRKARDGETTSLQLSGGLDSTTVGGIACAALPPDRHPRRAYSVVFPDHPTVDEEELIVEIAGALGTDSTRLAVRSGSVLEGALPYIERWELPPVSPNLFFWLRMLERAGADGTRVMLDGEGGDEIFGGSPYLVADRLLRRGPRAARDLVRRFPFGRPDTTYRQAWGHLRRFGLMGLAPPVMHTASRRLRGDMRLVPPWLRPGAAAAFARSVDGAAWKRHGGPRWWAFLVDATTQGMGTAMAYDHGRRRAAMAGLVPRHPIADPDVIETMLSLPPDLQFDPRFTRPVVREAMRGLIPESVRTRPTKSTFDAIFHDSLAGADLPLVRGLLGDPDARVGAFVELPAMRAALIEPDPPARGHRQSWALQVWRLLTLESWLRRQEDPDEPRKTAEAIGLPEPDVRFVAATR